MRNSEIPHPIFKWAGGKTSILPVLDSMKLIPESFKRYYEPFFGAGAVFFHLWYKGYINKATLSDINTDLYNVYNLIKTKCDDLLDYCQMVDLDPSPPTYYPNRERFNFLRKKSLDESSFEELLERAVLMLYLNRTCYSGLYRENKNGDFNVPCGNYPHPTIIDEDNFYAVRDSFKNVTFFNKDYKTILKRPRSGDFVYLDPPYMPYGTISHFIDYHRTGFDFEEQNNLCNKYVELNERKCKLMLSNSSNPQLNKMYTSQMHNLTVLTIPAERVINRKRIGKSIVDEYLIINY